jgi:hypothetical protein
MVPLGKRCLREFLNGGRRGVRAPGAPVLDFLPMHGEVLNRIYVMSVLAKAGNQKNTDLVNPLQLRTFLVILHIFGKFSLRG